MPSAENHPSAKVYLALGDSMSIDDYTGVAGGGAVAQFKQKLRGQWTVKDFTVDGCTIPFVPRNETGDIITLTIGGNDALCRQDEIMRNGPDGLLQDHLDLLQHLSRHNPRSCLIVGNIYAPQVPLPSNLSRLLIALNGGIGENAARLGCRLADIYQAFQGHEAEYLCQNIEPTLKGAAVIAGLFEQEYKRWQQMT